MTILIQRELQKPSNFASTNPRKRNLTNENYQIRRSKRSKLVNDPKSLNEITTSSEERKKKAKENKNEFISQKEKRIIRNDDNLGLSNELLSKSNYQVGNDEEEESESPTPDFVEGCWYPKNLVQLAKHITSQEPKKMKKPDFKFEFTSDAAIENWKLLSEKYGKNLGKALDSNPDTQLSYGSEFRETKLLELIFSRHPLWKRMKQLLEKGACYPLEDLENENRKKDLQDALEFGNHKGVSNNPELFEETMKEEVENGWSLIIPRKKAIEIEGALMAPMNIHAQSSINEVGEIISKDRLTHNQSKEFSSGTSVNSRVVHDSLQDIMYGTCLLRVIHYIVALRSEFEDVPILLQKIDWKAAYRRGHLNWETAIQTMTQDTENDFVFVALRMTFGGAANPYFWGEISESVIDLANALLQIDDWDPNEFHSPLQHLLPEPTNKTEGEAITKAMPIAVKVNTNNGKCKSDIYIDDGTTIILDTAENRRRGSAAVLLAIHIVGRAFDKYDPLKRKELVSLSKLHAEGRLEETKILLGWQLDTRKLEVSLPTHKYTAWSNIIKKMLDTRKSNFDELESTLGRLAHVFTIIPQMKHFTSRIRFEMIRSSNRRNKKGIKLSNEVIEDLKLHLKFLRKAKEGISMNVLTYREPTHIYRSDACPAGIGGFSAKGRAWRWEIPKDLRFRATLNMLEHVAAIVGPWIDITEGNMPKLSCILSMTDSSTAAGWLRKSNFSESKNENKELISAKLKLSRSHALRLLENGCCDYSQWFPGEENELSDSLSRDFHLTNSDLTKLYFSKIPEQTPKDLEILPLPKEIESFLYSTLHRLPERTQQQERHKRSNLALGRGGHPSSDKLESETPSSKDFQEGKNPSFSQPLHNQLEIETFQRRMANPWFAQQSDQPWTTYLRPSETLTNPTLGLTKTKSLSEFYNNSTKATKMRIQQRDTKKQSL